MQLTMKPMKNRPLIIAVLLIIIVLSSCYYHHSHDVSISIQEDEEEYRLLARFDERKTKLVQNYINQHAGNNNVFKTGRVKIDASTTIEDDIPVYIKFHPGRLKIKFNKEENPEESYEKVKDMCEGIKDLLAEN